jgi:hypothetical protein
MESPAVPAGAARGFWRAYRACSTRLHARALTLRAIVWCSQAQCGSCWAVSAASTLSDRFCVHAASAFAAAGPSPAALSPQPLLSCATAAAADADDAADNVQPYQSEGCNGGFQDEAWRFLQSHGVAAMSADQARFARFAPASMRAMR